MAKTKRQKREEAQERLEKWNKLTPEQQLQSLNKRKMVAIQQRKKILSKINDIKKETKI